jgi:hypothetical protein
MLKGIHPLLGPDLLHAIATMGHGDEIVIADGNFPASTMGPPVIRADGVGAVEILEAILDENGSLKGTHRLSRESITYEPYGIAVRMGGDELRIALDRVLVEMFRSGSIQDLLAEHIPGRRLDPMLVRLFAIQSLPD